MKRLGVVGKRLASVFVLALEVGKQLDRLYVGVAVDDAPRHRSAHVGERFRSTPYSRHEKRQRRHIEDDPQRQWASETPIGPREDEERAESKYGDEPQRVDDLHHRVAQRRRGLHDVGGDAAREVIGEIADRLAQHILMRLPADEIRHSRRDRLLDDEVMGEARQRAADEDQERHRQELAAIGMKHLIRAGRTQEIDERADEAQDRDFDQRDDEADRHQGDKIRPDLPAIASVVAEQGRWRRAVIVVAKRIDAGFEETEHELVSNGNRGRSRIRKRRRARRQKRRSGRQIEKKDND